MIHFSGGLNAYAQTQHRLLPVRARVDYKDDHPGSVKREQYALHRTRLSSNPEPTVAEELSWGIRSGELVATTFQQQLRGSQNGIVVDDQDPLSLCFPLQVPLQCTRTPAVRISYTLKRRLAIETE